MASFVFRAVDLAGVPARGEVDAESMQAVTDQLKARGLIVLDIDAKKGSKELSLSFLERVKARDLSVMTDRKSTRLNSSHLVISYAVFCLKKNKRQRRAHTVPIQSQLQSHHTCA